MRHAYWGKEYPHVCPVCGRTRPEVVGKELPICKCGAGMYPADYLGDQPVMIHWTPSKGTLCCPNCGCPGYVYGVKCPSCDQ